MKTTKEKIAIMQGCNDDFSNLEVRLVTAPSRSEWMPYELSCEPIWDWADVEYRLTQPKPKVHKVRVYVYVRRYPDSSMAVYTQQGPQVEMEYAGTLLAWKIIDVEITEGEGL